MAYTIDKTVEALKTRFKANNFKPITLKMKCNGDNVVVTPDSYGSLKTIEDAVYFLVDSPSLPWLGGDTLEEVAEQLNNYENLVKKYKKDNIVEVL